MFSRAQLLNLFDMVIQLGGQEVAYAYGYLANAYGISTNEPMTRGLGPDQVKFSYALNEVEKACAPSRLDLPVTLDYIPVVRNALSSALTYADVQAFVGQLRERMHSELKAKLFLYLPSRDASFYRQKEAFGSEVAQKFPEATSDVEAAGDCIALGVYTASVFHLMRIMERGVQRLGEKLGISLAGEKNWQNILDEINKAIKSMPEDSAALKARKSLLAGASGHLYNVKLAWRNEVMHPRASYSEADACDICTHVKMFMGHLAAIV
jgi:hypothetical protein